MQHRDYQLQFNLTDSQEDLERFASQQELWDFIHEYGFDGIELMHMEADPRSILTPEMVVGYHMSFPQYWLDFWRGDLKSLLKEFDNLANLKSYYGGLTSDSLVKKIREEFRRAQELGAEYAVLHVSDAAAFEEITGKYRHTDAEVIQGFCELVNEALADAGTATQKMPWLLMENLWQPGLTFTDPEMTAMLLEGIRYPKKGIMLDTGHLIHTEPRIRSQKEAVNYIHRMLDVHGTLCKSIKGVHLQQSMTGKVMRQYQKNPPKPAATWEQRMSQLFTYVFAVDQHRPFTGEGVKELVERIAPSYLTFEFITRDLAEHKKMLRQQAAIWEGETYGL